MLSALVWPVSEKYPQKGAQSTWKKNRRQWLTKCKNIKLSQRVLFGDKALKKEWRLKLPKGTLGDDDVTFNAYPISL